MVDPILEAQLKQQIDEAIRMGDFARTEALTAQLYALQKKSIPILPDGFPKSIIKEAERKSKRNRTILTYCLRGGCVAAAILLVCGGMILTAHHTANGEQKDNGSILSENATGISSAAENVAESMPAIEIEKESQMAIPEQTSGLLAGSDEIEEFPMNFPLVPVLQLDVAQSSLPLEELLQTIPVEVSGGEEHPSPRFGTLWVQPSEEETEKVYFRADGWLFSIECPADTDLAWIEEIPLKSMDID